jgi:hypothetical protein
MLQVKIWEQITMSYGIFWIALLTHPADLWRWYCSFLNLKWYWLFHLLVLLIISDNSVKNLLFTAVLPTSDGLPIGHKWWVCLQWVIEWVMTDMVWVIWYEWYDGMSDMVCMGDMIWVIWYEWYGMSDMIWVIWY